MRTVAIVQARMGSSRLSGKVLEDIEGKPMLWHIVNRLKTCIFIDLIVVATTIEKKDDAIAKFCMEHGIEVFRGSENDVLDRYYQAAKNYRADVIVRITADCAVIDPKVTDYVISRYLENKNDCDFCSNVLTRTYPNGLETEVVPMDILRVAWEKAKKECYREHVTLFFGDHPELFRLHNVSNNKDLSHLRWTVDQKEDLELIRQIYKRLYSGGKIFYMKDIFGLLHKEPHLKEINKAVKHKVYSRALKILQKR